MEKYLAWFATLAPFFIRKLMVWGHCSPKNILYVGLGNLEWPMIAIWIFALGYHFGLPNRDRQEKDYLRLKDDCVNEINKCYSRFEKEYVPLREKMEVLKFELEKEQWRVKVLREGLEAIRDEQANEQAKKKRSSEQANKEAMHSVGGN